MKASQKL